jgi:hypothetical protein
MRSKRGLTGLFALKLDMSKAYDFFRLEDLFYGFSSRFRQLIMMCISTASFSVLINGNPEGDQKEA